MGKIEFSIPGFYRKTYINDVVLDDYVNRRYMFNDDIEITSCYDSFPCIWNGGRISFGSFSPYDVYDTLNYYNNKGISLRYTFTNPLIEEEHLTDAICNMILDITSLRQKIKTGININSNLLKNYILSTYAEDKFYFLTSTTTFKKDIKDINEHSKNNIVVPDYSLNNNFDLIKDLVNKENIEFLIGEPCIDNCPNRSKHYNEIAKFQLDLIDRIQFKCPNGCEDYDYDLLKTRKHYISLEDIRTKYIPLGFNKFKISGRTELFTNVIEKYIDYLVKPEYQKYLRNKWLNYVIRYKNLENV